MTFSLFWSFFFKFLMMKSETIPLNDPVSVPIRRIKGAIISSASVFRMKTRYARKSWRIKSSPIYVEAELKRLCKKNVECEIYPTAEIAGNATDPESEYHEADREKCIGGTFKHPDTNEFTWWLDPDIGWVGIGHKDNIKRV